MVKEAAGKERSIASIRLDGGSLALNFLNTVHDRFAAEREDYLSSPERLRDWALRVRLIDRPAHTLPASTKQARRLLRETCALREAMHGVFSAEIDGGVPPAKAVALFNAWIHRAWSSLALDLSAPDRLTPAPRGHKDLWQVPERLALAGLEELQRDAADRLKRCGACGWIFRDATRNKSRRWCAMETCGATHKMRRYRKLRPKQN